MKKLIYTTACVLLVAGSWSCSKMIDDIAPKNAIKVDLLTDNDLGKLTNGVSYRMEGLVTSLWHQGDFLAENYTSGPGFDYPDVHAETQAPASSMALSAWRDSFDVLNDVNELLKAAKGTAPQAVNAAGTAYFYRAWIYYNLVIRFGGVPLLTAPASDVVPISAEDAIWTQVISDCRAAIERLPETASIYYPTKNAAKLLLARTLLWKGENGEAASLASEVIATPAYALEESSDGWAKMFVYGTSSKEIVFALANVRASGFNLLFERVNDTDGSWNYSPAPKYYNNLFSDTAVHSGDIRGAATFSALDASRVIKLPNGQGGQFVENAKASNSPIVLFRLADAYLIRAEALGKTAGKEVLKTFMEKRYATVNLPASPSDSEWQDLLLEENNREFFAEGRRWFEIKRTGRTDLYDSWEGRDFLLYWPIPQKERDIAGKTAYPQNPGYND